MGLTTLIAAALFAASPAYGEEGQTEIAFKDRPIEYRTCPPESEYNKPKILADGQVIRSQPSRFCYEEVVRPFIYQERGTDEIAMVEAKVYYLEEGILKRDAWSGRDGYPRTIRQLIIEYNNDNDHYELWFITDPKADGRGLADRVGDELIQFTRDQRAKSTETSTEINQYVWHHGEFYSGISGNEENVWQYDALIPNAKRIMRFMRKQAEDAHTAVKGYSIDYDPDRTPNPNPIFLTNEERIQLYALTEKLYRKADKKEERKQERAAGKKD